MEKQGMKFTASYSGGKDSILALYRAIRQGMRPESLIITYRTDLDRSWFHGVPKELLQAVSAAIGLPIHRIETTGQDYAERFIEELKRRKQAGCEACVFGDIDIADHLAWCQDVCRSAGIKAVFPLWHEPREALVRELIEAGFTARLTVVDTARLSQKHLSEVLSEPVLAAIEAEGADVCGENGEYHSFVTDGPLFSHPVTVQFGAPFVQHGYAILPMTLPEP